MSSWLIVSKTDINWCIVLKHACANWYFYRFLFITYTSLFHFYIHYTVIGLGLGLMVFGLDLIRVPWPRSRPHTLWSRSCPQPGYFLASLTSLKWTTRSKKIKYKIRSRVTNPISVISESFNNALTLYTLNRVRIVQWLIIWTFNPCINLSYIICRNFSKQHFWCKVDKTPITVILLEFPSTKEPVFAILTKYRQTGGI